jgi:hypothetical protein
VAEGEENYSSECDAAHQGGDDDLFDRGATGGGCGRGCGEE